jgi:hypothetical protein
MLLRLLAGSSHSAAFLHTVQLLLRGRPNGVHAVMRGFRRLVSHNSEVHGAIEKPDRGHTSPCGTPARATQRSLGVFSGLTQKRGRVPWLLFGLASAAMLAQFGWGGGGTKASQPTSYTITVTADASGGIQHATQVTVSVP